MDSKNASDITAVSAIVEIAAAHIIGKSSMASSAQLCLDDARALIARGDYRNAARRVVRSLDYSVGIFHADRTKAARLAASL